MVNDNLLTRPAAGLAVRDALALLRLGFPHARVNLNDTLARVRIVLTGPAIGRCSDWKALFSEYREHQNPAEPDSTSTVSNCAPDRRASRM